MYRFVLCVLIISPALTACSGQATPTPDAVATQVAVLKAAAATLTAQAPTATPTAVLIPTTTPAPTDTPTLIAETPTPTMEIALVTEVIDGDTIEVQIGEQRYKVRYIGIDTPETKHPEKPVEWMGPEAAAKNEELVGGKLVRLEKDVSETDKYGRLLRYVWVGDMMVNAELVRLGFAQVSTYPPDVKYVDLFLKLQQEAREARRGLWRPAPKPVAIVQGDRVNVRQGPGTAYPHLGQVTKNTRLEIVGRNPAGDWWQVCCVKGQQVWIAGWLVQVEGDISGVQVAAEIPTPPPTPPPQPTATPIPPTETAPPQPAGTGNVVISHIFYDGVVYRVESDEYAQITNKDTVPVNLGGWHLNAGDPGQDFWFPSFVIQPGQSCRVYTNEYHPESCGFSFGSGRAIWNNKGDCGYLYDASGTLVSQYCYYRDSA